MNPFLRQILGTLVRAAILWLAAKFGADISDDEAVKLAGQIVPILIVVGWSVYQKYRGRLKLLAGLASSHRMTEHEVEAIVSAGDAPAVSTPKTVVPA